MADPREVKTGGRARRKIKLENLKNGEKIVLPLFKASFSRTCGRERCGFALRSVGRVALLWLNLPDVRGVKAWLASVMGVQCTGPHKSELSSEVPKYFALILAS